MADTNERVLSEKEKQERVLNAAGKEKSGYCPYTPDRTCKTGKGGWSDSEECKYCGWRAW